MNFKAIFLIFIGMTLLTFSIFAIVIIQEGLGNDLFENLDNVSKTILDNATHEAEITQRITQYNDKKLDYDTMFIIGLIILEVTAVSLAVASPKLPNADWITFLFFGTIMLIFIYPIMIDINSYVYEEFIIKLFDSTTFTMPFYNYVLGHQLYLVIGNIIFLLGINKIFGKKERDLNVNSPFAGGE